MEPRQEQLLNLVIENHIKLAEPIGSKFLVSEVGLDWSEATVRNELRALEESGFLTHPHTSAGRIPTAQGYRYYVDHAALNDFKLPKSEEKKLEEAAGQAATPETVSKNIAKSLVDIAEEAVLLAFSPDRVYYTGLSTLFRKPDFADLNLVADVSSIFDRCEEALDGFFDEVGAEPRVFIGAEHGFGDILSIIAIRCGTNNQSLLALVGPQRMEYGANWALIKKAHQLYTSYV